ncbi:MAG: L,D-transpeptidase [Verrucomicrobium sp.]|nr:L,D-transpeptidase [Verrucomicrobium sp.]
MAEFQILLERLHYSCGFIDGEDGARTRATLRAFQQGHGLPATGLPDEALWRALRRLAGPSDPFTSHAVTAQDLAHVGPPLRTWTAKSEAESLGYTDLWEYLGARFHAKRAYLRRLNPGPAGLGTVLRVPNLSPSAPAPAVASLRIRLGAHSLDALDASGRVVAHFPCSIAKEKEKRPAGELRIAVLVPHPNYTFDPALFPDAAAQEGITHRLIIPPGPRNPVGVAWIGLSLPTYGIHGTPEPEAIGRTGSHGCFRLTNWNVETLLPMVRIGMKVDVEP